MLDKEQLYKKVRRIEIKTRSLADNVFSGGYHSAFKGRGMSFAEVRGYQPGDDVRSIDWNVTARLNRTHIKVFEEERELTVMLLVDISQSCDFGTRMRSVRELLAEIGGTIAFSANSNHDKVGLILFSDRIEKYIPPQKGRKHTMRIIQELLCFNPIGRGTDINVGLKFMVNAVKRRSVCFLISDFINPESIKDSLLIARKKHDIVALHIVDHLMYSLPAVGFLRMTEFETGKQIEIDCSDKNVRKLHDEWWKKHITDVEDTFNYCGTDFSTLPTDGDYIKSLKSIFAKRN